MAVASGEVLLGRVAECAAVTAEFKAGGETRSRKAAWCRSYFAEEAALANDSDEEMRIPTGGSLPLIRVKNTFLELSEDDLPEMGKSHTWSSPMVRRTSSGTASEASVESVFQQQMMIDRQASEVDEMPCHKTSSLFSVVTHNSYDSPLAPISELKVTRMCTEKLLSLLEQPSLESPRLAEHCGEEPLEERFPVVPLEIRQPEFSQGSGPHAAGSCKPCMWYWKAEGCANGASCRHCHLCQRGAVAARRRSRRHAGKEGRTCSSYSEASHTGSSPRREL